MNLLNNNLLMQNKEGPSVWRGRDTILSEPSSVVS